MGRRPRFEINSPPLLPTPKDWMERWAVDKDGGVQEVEEKWKEEKETFSIERVMKKGNFIPSERHNFWGKEYQATEAAAAYIVVNRGGSPFRYVPL